MNISSVILTLSAKDMMNFVLGEIEKISSCELVTSENLSMVLLIMSNSIDDEVAVFRALERIDGVVSVTMAYSYQEDIHSDIEKLKGKSDISKILQDDDIKAENIIYGGSVGSKIK